MGGRIKPIGGEFWFDNSILSESNNNLHNTNSILLDGGQSAIEFILQDINFKESEFILMPSYLCPTILYKLKQKKINMLFYGMNEDLSINIENINELIKKFDVKALFFVNYFGFYHNDGDIEYLKILKNKGLILIEDAVQMLWFNRMNKFIGDYVFNSYRKFFAVDGSFVLCNKNSSYNAIRDEYYNLTSEARISKTKYIISNMGREDDFLDKFREAEEWYYKRTIINGMDKETINFLNHVNYTLLREQRVSNYNYLYDNLRGLNKVKLLFNKDQIQDNVPMALPIVLHNRDYVRNELRRYNIYCPIHWDITEESWAVNFQNSLELSKSILTIPIDWRYNKEDIDYFLKKFHSILI